MNALLKATLEATLQGARAAATPTERARLRARALLLASVAAARPWLLLGGDAGEEARAQAQGLRHTVTARVEEVSALGASLRDALGGALAVFSSHDSQGALDATRAPGAALATLLGWDALDAATIDLLHGAAGADPLITQALAAWGALRPIDAAAAPYVTRSLIAAGLTLLEGGAAAYARLARLCDTRGVLASEAGLLGEQSVALSLALRRLLAWASPADAVRAGPQPLWGAGPAALHDGALWPHAPLPAALTATLDALWPEARAPRLRGWRIWGGHPDEARWLAQWLTPDAPTLLTCRADAAPTPRDWGTLRALAALGCGPTLLTLQGPVALTEATQHAPSACVLHIPAGSAAAPDPMPGWFDLDLSLASWIGERIDALLTLREPALAALWRGVLGNIAAPIARLACLETLSDPSRPTPAAQSLRDAFESFAAAAPPTALDGLARRVSQPFTPVVLPPRAREVFDEARDAVRHGRRLAHRGQLAQLRGARLIILLQGGHLAMQRAMAWQLAQAWEQALYEIEPSRIVSRWIGEAEQRLGALMTFAQRTRCALFLGGAEGLLSKRTEVKHASDRYSAMQVNFMLQALDAFEGLFILATDRADDLDSALMRRVLFRIEIPAWGPAERLTYLRALIPPEAPIDDDIAWDQLAEDAQTLDAEALESSLFQAALRAAHDRLPVQEDHMRDAMRDAARRIA
jgi:hypothetical protein